MSPVRDVTHATPGECVKYLEARVSDLTVQIESLRSLVNLATHGDERKPVCPFCNVDVRRSGDFAMCDDCGRLLERRVLWLSMGLSDD